MFGGMRKQRALKDYTGSRFGRLVALYPSAVIGRWVWACDCGMMAVKSVKSVRDGSTRSCGCIKREQLAERNTKHGLSSLEAKTYRSWKDMRARCYNPKNTDYQDYGGRGIAVCDRWDSFSAFFEDMGACPEDKTIDRIDVNMDYEPANCRWADAETQANNKRASVKIAIGGVTKTLSQWCRVYGVERSKAGYRHRMGLDPFSLEDFRK